ncbi:MAG: hypothetical protein HUU18_10310 [Phycisphaerales bacterium]|jgi:hypothetical protein|nr:hypothetical protein [Phycisphaerales bacterium]
MAKRHWLLIAACGLLAFAFVLIRTPLLYWLWVDRDLDTPTLTWIIIAFLASWTTLEVTHQVLIHRRTACPCGYSLKGVKCPECGRDVGTGAV